MNQILSTSMPMDKNKKNKNKNRNRNSNPIAVESILKFFGIAILVFGVFMVGTGTYAIYRNQSVQEEQNLEPTISIENKTDKSILLKVMHQKVIDKVEYSWNEEDKTVLNGNNGKYLEKEINIPSGTNTLHVLVQDETGKQITYEKQYQLESNINFEVSGNKIKITYEGDSLVSYMTYRWDEEEEETIEINDTKVEQEIEAIKGLHTLTVVVVDENNNTDTKVQKINGVSKPNLKIECDEEVKHFVIIASDDEKITRVEFKLNQDDGQQYLLNFEDRDLKELNYTLPMELQSGDNVLEVTVYNSNGVSNYSAVRLRK